jgi:glycerol-3-phosphate dehydrogenase (NAD(P)+)
MVAVVSSCEVVLMVVPTPFVARTLAPVVDKFMAGAILVSCTKGILNDTLETRE